MIREGTFQICHDQIGGSDQRYSAAKRVVDAIGIHRFHRQAPRNRSPKDRIFRVSWASLYRTVSSKQKADQISRYVFIYIREKPEIVLQLDKDFFSQVESTNFDIIAVSK